MLVEEHRKKVIYATILCGLTLGAGLISCTTIETSGSKDAIPQPGKMPKVFHQSASTDLSLIEANRTRRDQLATSLTEAKNSDSTLSLPATGLTNNGGQKNED